MPTNSPVPTSYGLLLPWLENFNVKFPVHGPGLGYTPTQITAAQADCNEGVHFLLNVRSAMQRDAQEMGQYIKLKLNGPLGALAGPMPVPAAIPAASPAVAQASCPDGGRWWDGRRGEGQGQLHAIHRGGIGYCRHRPDGGYQLSDPDDRQSHGWRGDSEMEQQGWDGVKVQGRVSGGMAWTELGSGGLSPFVDTCPQAAANTPEEREYRMCHLYGDTPLNNWSDVLVVNVNV